ncbi:MAG: NapC/NirT family cytochrome c [Deltaproteobacteria bacterium]|nr:NapC/NirT family cytochrome c [Deltaproteobacteria bacterium]
MMRTEIRKISKKLKIILIAVIVLVALFAVGAYKGYDYMEHDPRFCQSCHTMDEPFKKWQESPHHMVSCHECHKQTKWQSLHQVWMYITEQPKSVVHHPNLDQKVCAQCHLSQDTQWKLVGNTAGHKVHFEKAGIDCLECHMKGLHEFVRPVDSCAGCHPDKMEGNSKMSFIHCLQCHNFLAKGEDLKPTTASCKTCHDRIQTEKLHPPIPKDTECISCHKPHELK